MMSMYIANNDMLEDGLCALPDNDDNHRTDIGTVLDYRNLFSGSLDIRSNHHSDTLTDVCLLLNNSSLSPTDNT